tara:strand:+ start:37 stop:606 length:570 start_codon:yes stop_codon:yes gene_type:complete
MAISKLDLTKSITGTLPVANGGTALTSGFVNGGLNTPAFEAKMTGASTAITEAALVTLTIFNSEDYDSHNCFDPSTGKFIPTVAGKYFAEVCINVDRGGSTMSDLLMAYVQIFKNGTDGSSASKRSIGQHDMRNNAGRGFGLRAAGIFDMNGTDDYLISAVSSNTDSNNNPNVNGESNYSYFRAFRILT